MVRWTCLPLFALLGVVGLYAQTMPANTQPPSQSQALSEGQQDEPSPRRVEESGAPVPLPLSIDASSLLFSSELVQSSYLELGLQTGATYDDNLLNVHTQQIGGFSYNIMPHFRLEEWRRRLIWGLNYAGGYSANERFSAYNQGSHNAEIHLRYRLSPHVNVGVRDNFIRNSVLFGQSQSLSTGGAVGAIQQPNQGIITPLSKMQQNLGAAEITYQFSRSNMVGATGTFFDSHFSSVSGTTGLLNTSTQEGDGFYTHRFSARNWSGIAYKFERLRFPPSAEEDHLHSILLFHTLYLQPRMALAFFAGPEYSQLSSQVVSTSIALPFVSVVSDPASRRTWTVSGGTSFSWQGKRTSVQANAVRKITDGGGLMSGVTAITGSAALRRRLGRFSVVQLNAVYGHNRSLAQSAGTLFTLSLASGSIEWERQLGTNLSVRIGYGRDYQQQKQPAASALDINHNRGWITLGYQFNRGLGR